MDIPTSLPNEYVGWDPPRTAEAAEREVAYLQKIAYPAWSSVPPKDSIPGMV